MNFYNFKYGKNSQELVFVSLRKYTNGATAIKLVSINDSLVFLTATVNMPNVNLEAGEVIIKKIALEFLLQYNIVAIRRTEAYLPGEKELVICDLLPESLWKPGIPEAEKNKILFDLLGI